MKYRNRKTGEIVDVINYSTPDGGERSKDDYVSYIDSKGVEHPREKGLHINWDFEIAPCISDFSYMRWEYITKSVSSINPMISDRFNIVDLGNEGWELCAAINYDSLYEVQFIFKRPIISNDNQCTNGV